MKKIISCLLVFLLLVSLAACGGEGGKAQTDTPHRATGSGEYLEPVETVEVKNPIASIYLAWEIIAGEHNCITAYEDERGGVYVEMKGSESKTGTVDANALHGIADTLESSGMLKLADMEEYTDGEQYASLFVEYADGTSVSADFSGKLPQDFLDSCAELEHYFKRLLRDVPEQ